MVFLSSQCVFLYALKEETHNPEAKYHDFLVKQVFGIPGTLSETLIEVCKWHSKYKTKIY